MSDAAAERCAVTRHAARAVFATRRFRVTGALDLAHTRG
jgi:hypothetical protein